MREPGDGREVVRLTWTGGFPPYDVHRRDVPQDVRDDVHILTGEITVNTPSM